MATYRVLDPTGTVVETKDIESAEDAHAWFVDVRADNSELGWRMEVQHTDGWSFFDDTEGAVSAATPRCREDSPETCFLEERW